MKIIGRTADGYLIDATPDDVEAITGQPARNSYDRGLSLSVGTILRPQECFKHIKKVCANLDQRKQIAEQLRAAAVVIETTPSPLEIPVKDEDEL